MIIEVYNESNMKFLPKLKLVKSVSNALEGEGIKEADINIVLLNNDDITAMNREYLEHNYATDVISFRIEDDPIVGEVYIGAEVAVEQAKEYKVSVTKELMRLAVHGTLHIIGYEDDTDEKKQKMHQLEDLYMKIN